LPLTHAFIRPSFQCCPAPILATKANTARRYPTSSLTRPSPSPVEEIALVANVILTSLTLIRQTKLKSFSRLEYLRKASQPVSPSGGAVSFPEDDLRVEVTAENDDLTYGTTFPGVKIDPDIIACLVRD
jgi:hypothetical protein